MSFEFSSILQMQEDVRLGKISCRDIVSHYIAVIETKKHLNVFLEVFAEEAFQKAEATDNKIKSSEKTGKLFGCVVALKDVISIKGKNVTASSQILKNFTSLYNATVVERLLAEDAIIIGRTNCDEFAMGSSNENSSFGNVLNDLDNTKVPGGSSGGSAVAVQAGMCMVSLGTDTGGSIRQPASFCGVIGMKPTYGRVSRYGVIAYASSFDQVGPFAKTADDAALILEVIAGKDEHDATTSILPVEEYSKEIRNQKSAIKYKFAYYPQAIGHEKVDPEIREAIYNTIEKLKADGHSVEAKDFKYLDYLVPVYYVLTTAEASSNLSRYAGIHYGYRDKGATEMEDVIRNSRSKGFGKEVQRRIMLGTFVLSSGYYDAYYTHAQKVRQIIRNETENILSQYDYIILPTTPTTAFGIGQIKDPIEMYLADIFTVQAPITGNPAISVPLFRHSNGMPFGLQIIGKRYKEKELLSVTKLLQQGY
ncbi:MAG: Asp-tRNA(Asn)/Glu-tRNA(Gln) amidotransferase subunit GatA [Fimbriimonadaceae bacterium]|nr:Asp-tRNA(Asn)/Glu-tRNA(Gln) amidotransferase subunit GatA [Chitinophagales bacterium]